MGAASVPLQSIAHLEWASVMKVEVKKGGMKQSCSLPHFYFCRAHGSEARWVGFVHLKFTLTIYRCHQVRALKVLGSRSRNFKI